MVSVQNNPRPLTIGFAGTEKEKVASLRLIADSIAQQRQTAAKALILHPLWLATVVLCLAASYYVLRLHHNDWPAIIMTWTGCVMTGLAVVRYLTASYLSQAEQTGTWKWLYEGSGHAAGSRVGARDHILVTKLGPEVIGALVLRPVFTSAGIEPHIRGARHFVRGQDMYFPVGVIRAWTVQRRYRGEGVGRELLERAVMACQAQGWGEPIFSQKHANAAQGVAKSAFAKGDDKARKLLETIIKARR
ncbi:uncharacterized protein KD926_000448 [Aspergillus affinis]|uniref:uncharacterized protein n=1 Tax=Aspergillus affinis TaxID=1070780 RepID=UPI0022FE88B2|nr:uncharacterized protein KD926_000448 [Aspergillus affinis]KAI9044537.1 hypothetical protein KD926_000448 [Aspergillus affinis]